MSASSIALCAVCLDEAERIAQDPTNLAPHDLEVHAMRLKSLYQRLCAETTAERRAEQPPRQD